MTRDAPARQRARVTSFISHTTVDSRDAYAQSVRADRERAAHLGVSGVPSLVTSDGTPFSGVRPVAELRALLSP